jgi:hypothetical protein
LREHWAEPAPRCARMGVGVGEGILLAHMALDSKSAGLDGPIPGNVFRPADKQSRSHAA